MIPYISIDFNFDNFLATITSIFNNIL